MAIFSFSLLLKCWTTISINFSSFGWPKTNPVDWLGKEEWLNWLLKWTFSEKVIKNKFNRKKYHNWGALELSLEFSLSWLNFDFKFPIRSIQTGLRFRSYRRRLKIMFYFKQKVKKCPCFPIKNFSDFKLLVEIWKSCLLIVAPGDVLLPWPLKDTSFLKIKYRFLRCLWCTLLWGIWFSSNLGDKVEKSSHSMLKKQLIRMI